MITDAALKIDCLKTYRNILKLHLLKLPDDMLRFGNYFVKSEFKLNYYNGDDADIKIFLKK
jgi:hypothetical protein